MSDAHPFLLRHQGPMLRVLGRVALGSVRRPDASGGLPASPGPTLRDEVRSRPDALLDAYARWSGAPEGRYDDEIPPHLFPQWCLPVASRLLVDLPFPLSRVLNHGVDVRVLAPLARGEKLDVTARLASIEEKPRGVRLVQEVATGSVHEGRCLEADLHAIVPLRRGEKSDRRVRKRRAPVGYDEVGRWDADVADAREFCWLTGDLNPIHWIPAAARRAGFPRPILHGFGILARTWEVLALLDPDHRLGGLEVRFLRPVVLPAAVHVLVASPDDEGRHPVRLLDAGGQTCMTGSVRFGS